MSNSSNRRLKRHGRTVPVVELRCPVCHFGLLCTAGEATPPKPGMVPYCPQCRKLGLSIEMRRKEYRSGPPDLIV